MSKENEEGEQEKEGEEQAAEGKIDRPRTLAPLLQAPSSASRGGSSVWAAAALIHR